MAKKRRNNNNNSTQKQLQNKFHQSVAFCGFPLRGGRGRWNQGAIGASTEVRLHRRRRRFAGRQSSHKKKYNGNANEPQTGQTYGQKHGQADRRAEDKTEP